MKPETPPSTDTFLTETDLARRWSLRSAKKLQADRAKGGGCPYLKIGGVVRYRLADVLEFEEASRRMSTSEQRGNQR